MQDGQKIKRALIYQIYPTSVGSLRDIADRIPQIAKLQPDYIWLNPIFASPWVDGGYDVSDYYHIDPRFGTMNDFRHLVAEAKKYNIGILLDLVLNHTSSAHPWFQKSCRGDRIYRDYYVWLNRPLNWNSFFDGPAFDYEPRRNQYYLHLYDKSQPDLNYQNPRVIREMKDIIKFWLNHGAAGFRVDSANVLTEKNHRRGYLPRLSGFFNYYQPQTTVQVLERLFDNKKFFTIAEPVGGEIYTKKKMRELTKNAFSASFNIGTLDIADTFFSEKSHYHKVNYSLWFHSLAKWCKEPTFSLALESHDTPRATSRFDASAKTLAMLQFLLPNNFPCIYQGQEIGTKNATLSNRIKDYPGVQSKKIYDSLRKRGYNDKEAMTIVKNTSRDNARQPIDWAEYFLQQHRDNSTLQFYYQLLDLWRNDPIIRDGKLKVKRISNQGIFDFYRILGDRRYYIHLDLSSKTGSYLQNAEKKKLLSVPAKH